MITAWLSRLTCWEDKLLFSNFCCYWLFSSFCRSCSLSRFLLLCGFVEIVPPIWMHLTMLFRRFMTNFVLSQICVFWWITLSPTWWRPCRNMALPLLRWSLGQILLFLKDFLLYFNLWSFFNKLFFCLFFLFNLFRLFGLFFLIIHLLTQFYQFWLDINYLFSYILVLLVLLYLVPWYFSLVNKNVS